MDEVSIVTRAFIPADDEACIYATWRNSSFYLSAKPISQSSTKFFSEKNREIKQILPLAKVKIACLSDSKETIVGYSVSRGTHLDWIYVKPDYRMQGVATLLLPKEIKTVTPDLTKIGIKIVNKKNLKIADPAQENENEERIQGRVSLR